MEKNHDITRVILTLDSDKKNDTYIIANFGALDNIEGNVQTLIDILLTHDKMEV